MNENELLDIAKKLYDEYGSGKHWEIVKAEKNGKGWFIRIEPKAEEKDGGAANESN